MDINVSTLFCPIAFLFDGLQFPFNLTINILKKVNCNHV